MATSIEGKSLEEKKELLAKCAATTLSSKLIGGEKEFFASMVVDAVLAISNDDRLNLLGIKKVISQDIGTLSFVLNHRVHDDYSTFVLIKNQFPFNRCLASKFHYESGCLNFVLIRFLEAP